MPTIKVKVRHNQSLSDIALEQYGDVSGVYWLVVDNGLNGIVDNLNAGQELVVRDEYINKRIAEDMQRVGVATLDEESKAEGIGWWAIGKEFVVR